MDKFISDLVDSLPRRDIIEITLKNSLISMLINERVKNNETIQQMAHRLCMSKKRYQTWESGDHDFTVRDIAWICEKLELVPKITFECLQADGVRKEQEDESRENMG